MTVSKSSADCEFCAILRGEYESEEIYEDDKLYAVLHLKPAAPGHILLFTKEHYPIIEQVPDFVFGHALALANKLSIASFESLGVQGTNIIIENGVAAGQTIPHFSVHIIPRMENDGLGLQWQPKKISADELDAAYSKIKDKASAITPASFEKERARVMLDALPKDEGKKKGQTPVKPEDDYRLKQLRRVP